MFQRSNQNNNMLCNYLIKNLDKEQRKFEAALKWLSLESVDNMLCVSICKMIIFLHLGQQRGSEKHFSTPSGAEH